MANEWRNITVKPKYEKNLYIYFYNKTSDSNGVVIGYAKKVTSLENDVPRAVALFVTPGLDRRDVDLLSWKYCTEKLTPFLKGLDPK